MRTWIWWKPHDRGGNACNGDVDGGEIGDLSVRTETKVGEAVIPNVVGIWGLLVGEEFYVVDGDGAGFGSES